MSSFSDEVKTVILEKMAKEAKRVQRRIGAESCIVIGVFRDGNQLIFQDAGAFPMPPPQFYNVMIQAHTGGLMGKDKPKIIKPH